MTTYFRFACWAKKLTKPWPSTRRGLCLWMFAIAFLILGGVNYIVTDPPIQTKESLSFAVNLGGLVFWGCIMVVIAAVALFTSYCRRDRDIWGFVLMSTFCAGWGLVYICGFLFYDAGLRALSGSAIWFLFSGILGTIVGFPHVTLDPPPVIVDESEGGN